MRLNRMVCILSAMALCGCASQAPVSHGEEFNDNYSSRAIWQAMDQQAALGARDEATLHEIDFSGASLNGTGMTHIEEMLKTSPGPAVVYLDLNPKDNLSIARRDTTARYLAQVMTEGNAAPKVELGSNMATRYPAHENISRMGKAESPRTGTTETNDTNASFNSGGNTSSGEASSPEPQTRLAVPNLEKEMPTYA